MVAILVVYYPNTFRRLTSWALLMKLLSGKCHTFDDKFTLVGVMVWCCQVTSHYLSQCWPRFVPPYGIIRSQRLISFMKSTPLCIWYLLFHKTSSLVSMMPYCSLNTLRTHTKNGQNMSYGNFKIHLQCKCLKFESIGAQPSPVPVMTYIINWTPTNNLQWNFNGNMKTVSQEMHL